MRLAIAFLAAAAAMFAQTGADQITTAGSATGAGVRSVRDKANDFVTAKDYKAAGDGTTVDTTALQNALNSGAAVIDGGGLTYYVANLEVPSNVTLQNFKFKLIPGSATPTAGLIIDGTSAAKSNIVLKNITIDGQRKLMTNFGVISDGDKSCILAIGNVSNLTIDGVTANFCGTDGLQIWSYTLPATDNDTDLRFHHVTVKNSTFKYARRQGISLDSAFDVVFDHVVGEYNGLDMAEIQTRYAAAPSMNDFGDWQSGTYTSVASCAAGSTNGDCAARDSHGQYADGIDVEGYGVGSAVHDITVAHSTFLNNAAGGILFLDSTSTGATGFQPRQSIFVIGNVSDDGLHPDVNLPWHYAITIDGVQNGYKNITIAGNVFYGPVAILGPENAVVTGNQINSLGVGYAVFTASALNLEYSGNQSDAAIDFFDTLGSINQDFFARSFSTTTTSSSTNYAVGFGSYNTPIMAGSFTGFDAIQAFGTPLVFQPDAAQAVLVGEKSALLSKALAMLQVGGGVSAGGYYVGTTAGATTTVTCAAGTHISGITVSGGIVTAVGACN